MKEMVDEITLVNMIKEQATQNATIGAKLDQSNIHLSNINNQFIKVLERYDNFSEKMNAISSNVDNVETEISKQMGRLETHINWAMIILLALGVPIVCAVVKIAFF